MKLVGNYNLNIRFGDADTLITPQMIQELTITQDIERLLPTFKLSLADASKILAEIIPYDKNSNTVSIDLARDSNSLEINEFTFEVKRRTAISPEDSYTIEGILKVPQLLDYERNKYFDGDVKTNLQNIASNLGISKTEIGSSLSYEKSFLQPKWTDAQLLNYLKQELIGKNNESGYFCYIANILAEPILVFKSLNELILGPVRYNFLVGPKPHKDFLPISEYRIFDDSQLLVDCGGTSKKYSYFDYSSGSYINGSIDAEDCPVLSEFLSLDKDRENSRTSIETGRSNSFTDFEGRFRNSFFNRINNNTHMWAATWGLENISPGDVVLVIFSEAFQRGNLFVYQHSGLWLVKRVVHIIGNTFFTNLLLVRAGIDSDIENSLIESVNRRK